MLGVTPRSFPTRGGGHRPPLSGRLVLWLLLAALVAALTGLWRLANSRTFQLFGELVARAPCTEPLIALTLDDVPSPEGTAPVLELLARHDVQATFFLEGRPRQSWWATSSSERGPAPSCCCTPCTTPPASSAACWSRPCPACARGAFAGSPAAALRGLWPAPGGGRLAIARRAAALPQIGVGAERALDRARGLIQLAQRG